MDKGGRNSNSRWFLIGRISGMGLALISLTFWLVPSEVRGGSWTLIGIILSMLLTVAVSLAMRHHLATWSALVLLVAGVIVTHLWLWRMWPLWESSVQFVRGVNTVLGLLAIDLLVALLVDVMLMLLFRGGAPLLLGFVWVLYTLTLIGIAYIYPSMESLLLSSVLREQVLWLTPLIMLPLIGSLSGAVLIFQLTVAAVKELKAAS